MRKEHEVGVQISTPVNRYSQRGRDRCFPMLGFGSVQPLEPYVRWVCQNEVPSWIEVSSEEVALLYAERRIAPFRTRLLSARGIKFNSNRRLDPARPGLPQQSCEENAVAHRWVSKI